MIEAEDQIPDGLRRLYAEAVQFTEQMAAPQVLQSGHVGTDETGTVSVTIAPDGRVYDVELDPGWSSALTVEKLGGAVVEAVSNAALNRLGDWVDVTSGSAEAEGAGSDPGDSTLPRLPQVPPSGPLGDLSSPAVEASIAELFELMADARAAIDAAGRRLEERATAQIIGQSPGREVTITLQGNLPVEVELSPSWARRSSASEVGQALREAFTSAYRRQGSLTVNDLVADSPLEALRALTADPLALLRRVGLRADRDPDEGDLRATTY